MANEALCMMLWYYVMCTFRILDRALIPDVNNLEFHTPNATKNPSVKAIYQKWRLLILLKYQQIFNFIAPRLRKITRPFLKQLYWSKYLIYKW